jgi:hypothetical protein
MAARKDQYFIDVLDRLILKKCKKMEKVWWDEIKRMTENEYEVIRADLHRLVARLPPKVVNATVESGRHGYSPEAPGGCSCMLV